MYVLNSLAPWFSLRWQDARQRNDEFWERTGLCHSFDGTSVLFHHDVVAHGQS